MPAYLPPVVLASPQLSTRGGKPHMISGWDGPVEIVLPGTGPDWMHDPIDLCALIQDSMPSYYKTGGKSRAKGSPRHLRTAFSLRHANVKRLPKPRAGFSMEIMSSYAAIRNYGGNIPERHAKPGHPMSFMGTEREPWRFGRPATRHHGIGRVYTMTAKGYPITGLHFIEKGFTRWIKARGHWGIWLSHRMARLR